MSTKVSIKGLYKIFGPQSADMVDKVKNGVNKALEDHGHVLG